MSQSGWLNSLADPFNQVGAKIPDLVSWPSSTCQTIQRVQVSANAGGVAGICVRVGGFNTSAAVAADASIWVTNSASTAAAPVWTNTPIASSSALDTSYEKVRVVSAGVAAIYTGSTQLDSGRMFCTAFPGDLGSLATPNAFNDATINNSPLCRLIPVKKGYAQVLYVPEDLQALSYYTPGNPSTAGSLPYKGYRQLNWILILADGMSAGQMITFVICHNLECIPLTSTQNILQPTPARVDLLEMDVANRVIAENPFFATNQPEKSKPAEGAASGAGKGGFVATASHVLQEGLPFLEKVVGGMTGGSSFADTAMSLIPEVLALL